MNVRKRGARRTGTGAAAKPYGERKGTGIGFGTGAGLGLRRPSTMMLARTESAARFQNPLFSPLKLLPATELSRIGALPSYEAATVGQMLVDVPLDPAERAKTLVVFVSHRWVGKSSCGGIQPDTPAGDVHRVIERAVHSLKSAFAERRGKQAGRALNVLLWIDHCCAPSTQDASARSLLLLSLPGIMERCDLVVYPVLANSWYTSKQLNEWHRHPSRRFLEDIAQVMGGESGEFLRKHVHCQELFSRGWVRLETLLASTVPITPANNNTRWGPMRSGKDSSTTTGRRLLILSGPDGKQVVLPRISQKVVHAFDPSRGAVSVPTDRQMVDQIKSSSLAALRFGQSKFEDFQSHALTSVVEHAPSTTPVSHSPSQRPRPNASEKHIQPATTRRKPASNNANTSRRSTTDTNAQAKSRSNSARLPTPRTYPGKKPASRHQAKNSAERLHGKVTSGGGDRGGPGQHAPRGLELESSPKPHGRGVFRFENGGHYEGTYANGVPHGRGCYTDPSGKVELQRWNHGVLVELEQLSDPQQLGRARRRSLTSRLSLAVGDALRGGQTSHHQRASLTPALLPAGIPAYRDGGDSARTSCAVQ